MPSSGSPLLSSHILVDQPAVGLREYGSDSAKSAGLFQGPTTTLLVSQVKKPNKGVVDGEQSVRVSRVIC